MATNKAVQLTNYHSGSPQLDIVELPVPTPGAGEVLVKMQLRPVNPADGFVFMTVYPGFIPSKDNANPIAGLEGTGVVEAVGEGVSKFTAGQRVVGAPFPSVQSGNGTWQQYLVAPEDSLVAVPDNVSDESAAQFFINPVTVVGMLNVLDIPAGEYLIQTAAGSVLGRQMIQVCKHKGIKTINVVRRAEQVEELKSLGADEVIVSTEEDIPARVNEITGGKGAYGAIECVGGDLFAQITASVRPGGTVIIYGAMSGLTATFDIPSVLFRGVSIRGFWLIPYVDSLAKEEREKCMNDVMQLLADQVIVPYAGERFPLEKAQEAMEEASKAARGGKVLLEG
jgi:mitochondrial enoyl-[acyl-carrier protein] reductase / trans-2-enoyl-CoA reductase